MKYVTLPTDEWRRLSFYLAMEDYVARNMVGATTVGDYESPTADCKSPTAESADDGGHGTDLFFLWQVRPSVIFGRNQVMENEVNVDYCRQHGIEMFRRKSGGGCVYADEGNVMFSYITHDEDVSLVYQRFMSMLVLVLRRLGVEAVTTTHNDVMVDGRKVSGTAFRHLHGASIAHSTMLYDTRMEHMMAAITPPHEKLAKNGVESVRQRICLLKDFIPQTLDEFKAAARQTLCEGELQLTDADVRGIEELEQRFLNTDFIHLK